eukprot:CAMPEP_0197045196 /NCGR_PEP_ID=MMETSP1384-20130603/21110_1 /TAXON_ID=29189 /ORGANISM="Ammonia sp." /LENGTH=129 /DNA_ID=CAMNT_0042476771 /DNA_START=23 /DNA_END=409 /DNA_ORIENTATION=+
MSDDTSQWTRQQPLANPVNNNPFAWTMIQSTFFYIKDADDIILSYDIATKQTGISINLTFDAGSDTYCIAEYNHRYLAVINEAIFEMYDIQQQQWSTSLPSMVRPRTRGDCIAHNDYLYYIGGREGSST